MTKKVEVVPGLCAVCKKPTDGKIHSPKGNFVYCSEQHRDDHLYRSKH